MYRIGTAAAFIVLLTIASVRAQKTDASAPKTAESDFQPAPEMQRLYHAFVGNWRVIESFENNGQGPEKGRQGTASFRESPGASLIEQYRSTGSAGALSFLGLLWWDRPARVYRLLTCANSDGCQLRGTARWEGKDFVNTWEETVDGKTVAFSDSFINISPSSFQLVSQGTAGGKTIWRVITKYQRMDHQDSSNSER